MYVVNLLNQSNHNQNQYISDTIFVFCLINSETLGEETLFMHRDTADRCIIGKLCITKEYQNAKGMTTCG